MFIYLIRKSLVVTLHLRRGFTVITFVSTFSVLNLTELWSNIFLCVQFIHKIIPFNAQPIKGNHDLRLSIGSDSFRNFSNVRPFSTPGKTRTQDE